MADARGREYRKSHTSGIDNVQVWIGKYWKNVGELEFRELKISIPAPSSIKKLPGDEVFETAFCNKRDSALHSLLKYVAWNWLSKQKSCATLTQSELVRFEQMIYLPSLVEETSSVHAHPLGGDFDWTMAQPIRRGDQNVVAFYGKILTVDVFGKGTNIEVGNTTPRNLLDPMLYGLSTRSIWIPFPQGLFPKDFSLQRYQFRKVLAYEVK